MRSSYSSFSTRVTSQREVIPGRASEMGQNDGGGFGFKVDPWARMRRFLIMGSEGGTYYVDQKQLTKDNALNTLSCIDADGRRAVDLIADVSTRNLAPKNTPAEFSLALAASAKDAGTRARALSRLPEVCRIPSHLFHFVSFVRQFRGMGRGLKGSLRSWYQAKDLADLAYSVVKYQARDGFSNRDILRLVRPKAEDKARNGLYKWIVDGIGSFDEDPVTYEMLPQVVRAFEAGKTASRKELISLISKYNLSHEMIPTEAKTDPDVWEALLERMPPQALLRNLGNMSKCGLLRPLSSAAAAVIRKIADTESLRKRRVHPMAILIAMKQYASGKGLRGDGVWTPVPGVVDALDTAFYDSFEGVEPTGKDILIGVDGSGSMMGSSFKGAGFWQNPARDIAGTCLHPCEAAAALALACAKKEKNYYIMGYADQFRDLGITPRMRMDEVLSRTLFKTFGRTDCAIPMTWAEENKVGVDGFYILTDNDTYAGAIHPSQALRRYREKSGRNAKLAVVSMVPTGFSIADPKDDGMLDVAGFGADVPAVVSDFMRGADGIV